MTMMLKPILHVRRTNILNGHLTQADIKGLRPTVRLAILERVHNKRISEILLVWVRPISSAIALEYAASCCH